MGKSKSKSKARPQESPGTASHDTRSSTRSARTSDDSMATVVSQRKYTLLQKECDALERTLEQKEALIAELKEKNASLKHTIRASNETAGTGKKILNQELAKATKERSRQHISQLVKLVKHDKHAMAVAKKCLKFVVLPEDMTEEEYIRDYFKEVKAGIAEGRQYAQSRCKNAAEGKKLFHMPPYFPRVVRNFR